MVEIESVTVKLGEREYTVQAASFRRAKPFKARLLAEIRPLIERVQAVENVQFSSPSDLLELLPLAQDLLVDAPERLYEMMIAYSCELQEDAEYIADHATDKQIVAAFTEVARLSDPFGISDQIGRRLGRPTKTTSSN
jgi:hypothetical protein